MRQGVLARRACAGGHRGLTLIELLVTISVLGILASVAMPLAQTTATRTRELELRRNLRKIRESLDQFKAEYDKAKANAAEVARQHAAELQAFQRHVQDDYAPGYVPSELAQEMQRRRILQGGKLGFSSELFHIRNEQGGKMDWVRITGDLRMTEGLRIFTMGDLRRDDGLGLAGVHREERNLALSASELFGRSTLSGSVGYGRSEQSMTSTAQADLPAYLVTGDRASSSSFYALNFNSSVGRFPYGIIWTRYQASQSPAITTVGTHLDLNSGLLDVRFSVQVVRRQDGIRYTQFLVDLLRAFDTVALYRFGQR